MSTPTMTPQRPSRAPTNKDLATPHNILEDVAEQQEDVEEEAEVDERDKDAVGEHPTVTYLPCHMWEAPN